MVSHVNLHIRVASISFLIGNFVTYEKVLIDVIYVKIFRTFRILVIFLYFNVANFLPK